MKLKTDSMKNKTTTVLFLLLALLLCCASASTSSHTDGTERAWLTIISTTDLHGNIAPLDYYTNKPDARGLAKAATIIAQIRKENPNSLLLDFYRAVGRSPAPCVVVIHGGSWVSGNRMNFGTTRWLNDWMAQHGYAVRDGRNLVETVRDVNDPNAAAA